MNILKLTFSLFIATVAVAAPAFAERTLAKVEVFPDSVALLHARDQQSMVVQATFSDGVTQDITTEAKYTFANPALVKMADGLITPAADGATELKIEFQDKALTVPVTV